MSRLKDPLRRAAYLCELSGQAIGAEDNTAMPEDFLLQQMQWREALEDATTSEGVVGHRRRSRPAIAPRHTTNSPQPSTTAPILRRPPGRSGR